MADGSVAQLRDQAVDRARARDWPGLLALEAGLRADAEFWIHFWAPACAVAARYLDRADAWAQLEECVHGGFYQLSNVGAEDFDEVFGTDPDWPADEAGMPLGVLDLQQRFRDQDQPMFDGSGHNFDAGEAAEWFRYFYAPSVTDGIAWRPTGSFVPILEGSMVITCDPLADSDADAAPDLAAISTGVVR